MKIELLISTNSDVLSDLFETETPIAGHKKDFSEFQIQYVGSVKEQGLHGTIFNEILELSSNLFTDVAIGIFSNFLYDSCRERVKKLWINDKEVAVDKKEIEDAVRKEVK